MGTPEERRREAIRDEADRLHESAVWSSQNHFESAKWWRSVHWLLGFLAAAASAVAGILAFAQDQMLWTAGLAVLGAITIAAHTTLNPDRRAESAQATATKFLGLRNRARQVKDIYGPYEPLDALLARLETLTHDMQEAAEVADAVPRLAYNRAKRNIEKDMGQTFGVDA